MKKALEVVFFRQNVIKHELSAVPNEPPDAPNELTETPYEPADRPETPEDWPNGLSDRPNQLADGLWKMAVWLNETADWFNEPAVGANFPADWKVEPADEEVETSVVLWSSQNLKDFPPTKAMFLSQKVFKKLLLLWPGNLYSAFRLTQVCCCWTVKLFHRWIIGFNVVQNDLTVQRFQC